MSISMMMVLVWPNKIIYPYRCPQTLKVSNIHIQSSEMFVCFGFKWCFIFREIFIFKCSIFFDYFSLLTNTIICYLIMLFSIGYRKIKWRKFLCFSIKKKINHRNWDVNESWLTELTYVKKKQQQIFRYAKQINFFLKKNFKMKFCKILCLNFSVFFWLTYDIDHFFWFWWLSKLFWLFSYEKLTWWPDSAKHTHILYV